jgi:hypothetical protein
MRPGLALALSGALSALIAVSFSSDAAAGAKKKGKSSGPRPSEVSRSGKAPTAYHVFLEVPKDSAKAGAAVAESAKKALSTSFTRPGYVIDTPEEKSPKDHDELAKWLRDKDRTGLRLDAVVESIKESKDGGSKRYDATVRATVFTYPSGWLIMSTSGSAGSISDGFTSDADLKAMAVEAAVNGLVENIAAYLAKKPVPTDR